METIAQIRSRFQQAAADQLPVLIGQFENDSRSGVQNLLAAARRRLAAFEKERSRVRQMLHYEDLYSDFHCICGIDEAGRGPLAGPVVAAAVVLDPNDPILYVNDSKKLSARKREELYPQIMERAVSVGIGSADAALIDQINILQADYQAMRQAVDRLTVHPDLSLNDAVTIPDLQITQVPIIHGDAKSLSIAAASIIAKVTRDRMMEAYDQLYPQYHFAQNKGYGTADHIKALKKYGPCPIHRASFITHFI